MRGLPSPRWPEVGAQRPLELPGGEAIAVILGEAVERRPARAAELAADPAQRAWLEQQSAAKVAKSPERR